MGWSWWSLGNRPAFFPMVACLSGVLFGPQLGVPWAVWFSLSAIALWFSWSRSSKPGGVLLGLSAAACLGGGLAQRRADAPTLLPLGARVVLEGEVERVSTRGFSLQVLQVDGVALQFIAALSADEPPAVFPGQQIRVEARLKAIQEAANPGEWDRSLLAARRGQPVTGHYASERLVVLTPAQSWRHWVAREHRSLARDTHALTDDSAAAALLLTLSAGLRAELSDELEDDFSKSGLAHVLSVSGLHVAVFAFSLFAVLRWVLSRQMHLRLRLVDPRAYSAPLAIPAIWAFVLFTGWQGPAVRSALMCSLMLSAWVVQRRSDSLNALAVAALAMMVVDPAAPFELSIQLSFLAVTGLVLLSPTIREAIPTPKPSPSTETGLRLRLAQWRESAVQTFCASTAVTLTTGPLVAAAFQRVSLAGLISNVVTLPLSGLLTVVAAAGAALHVCWPPLAVPALWLGIQLSRLFVFIAETFARLPGASVELPAAEKWLLAAWWLGLLALVLMKGRWRMLALSTPVALGIHLLGPLNAGGMTVTFLAVGHGDAVVLSSQGQHALIDGGGVPQGHDTGQRFVVPFLRQQRIERLELSVLSHAHPDHALGLISTLEVIPTHRLWLPAGVGEGPLVSDLLEAATGAEIEEKEAGSSPFRLGEADIEVLGPPVDRSALEGENDKSIVLLLHHGNVTFLLTGDVESAGEAPLKLNPVTVVKAPHHGSDTSSTTQLVQQTKPQHVVFCVGRKNRFNFPRSDVVERWKAVGSTCHRTDLHGAITFHSDGETVTVKHHLNQSLVE